MQFQGKWYELKWIIEPWIKPEWNYLDYFQDFTLSGDDFSIYALGREKASDPYCTEGQAALYSIGKNSKYVYNRKYNRTTRLNSTYFIIKTDYDNYALTYGCRELADNGTCVQPDCWLWSRRQKLEDSYMEEMESELPNICVTEDMLFVNKQDKECTTENMGFQVESNIYVFIFGLTILLALQ